MKDKTKEVSQVINEMIKKYGTKLSIVPYKFDTDRNEKTFFCKYIIPAEKAVSSVCRSYTTNEELFDDERFNHSHTSSEDETAQYGVHIVDKDGELHGMFYISDHFETVTLNTNDNVLIINISKKNTSIQRIIEFTFYENYNRYYRNEVLSGNFSGS